MNWLTGLFDDGSGVREPDATTEFETELFTTLVKPRPCDRILDCGSGEGRLARALAARGQTHVSGVEQTDYSFGRAKRLALRQGLNVSFSKADPRHCPFADESFDAVAMLGESFARPNDVRQDTAAIAEALRLLRPSGQFVLGVADGNWRRKHYQPDSVEILADGFIYRRTELSADRDRLITHELVAEQARGVSTERVTVERLYGALEITDLLRRAGFDGISICHGMPFQPASADEAKKGAPRLYASARAPASRRQMIFPRPVSRSRPSLTLSQAS